MPYNPQVTDMRGQYMAHGISQAGSSIADMLKMWGQKEEEKKDAIANAKADEQWISRNAELFGGEDKTKELLEVDPHETPKQRAIKLKQAMANTVTGVTIQSRQQEIAAHKAQMDEANAKLAAFNQQQQQNAELNQRLGTFSQMGNQMSQGQPSQAPAMGGPQAMMQPAPGAQPMPGGAPSYGSMSGPASLGNIASMTGTPGNLAGGGVVTPQASEAAQAFINSPIGRMKQLGATITPEMMERVELAKIPADAREEVAAARAAGAKEVAQMKLERASGFNTPEEAAKAAKAANAKHFAVQQNAQGRWLVNMSVGETEPKHPLIASIERDAENGTITKEEAAQYKKAVYEKGGQTGNGEPNLNSIIALQFLKDNPEMMAEWKKAHGKAAGATAPADGIPVLTPEQAQAAKPGTRYRGTDGKVRIR